MSPKPYQFKVSNDAMFVENSYVVYRTDDAPCWIIDPGLPPQGDEIIDFIQTHRLKPQACILTHAHGDHIAGVDQVRDALGPMPLYLAQVEWPMLSDPRKNLSAELGLDFTVSTDDLHDLPEGLELTLDGGTWKVLDTAGHSPGGRSLYCAAENVVIVGDALFAGSVGRVDFDHSDGELLINNIRQKLMTLPDQTVAMSGHGHDTTIGHERATNPFILNGL
ncbi:MAG: MBL fold metallo-hydrolase [Phycisphaerae bacterium]